MTCLDVQNCHRQHRDLATAVQRAEIEGSGLQQDPGTVANSDQNSDELS